MKTARFFPGGLTIAGVVMELTAVLSAAPDSLRWDQSYRAGYADESGAHAGGSEIMHLAAHKGKLFASNGYWVDARWVIPPDGQKQSAQVLRLDQASGLWQVDLDLGRSNGLGLDYMKGNILKSVTFTRDGDGKDLSPSRTLLVMAAGANFERGGAVSCWVRNDDDGDWVHTLVRHGSSAGGVRWVPRDMEVHRDAVTGVDRLFMSLGNPGIISGVYDPAVPGGIRWERNLEYPFLTAGSFKTRPLGMARANGSLFFSEGDSIFRRVDGARPRYEEVLDLFEDTDTDVGGIRGLTSVAGPGGQGESLLFLWAPGDRSASEVMRLDPDGNGGWELHRETRIIDLMSKALGVEVSYTLGAHNMMYPVRDPVTGQTVHLIGFQGNIRGKHHLRWKGSALYGGAMYAVRRSPTDYRVHEINNSFQAGKPILVAPRAFCLSPFGDGQIYVGGYDASRKVSDDMAWIFRAPLEVALGHAKGADAPAPPPAVRPEQRLLDGPVYELRIYQANEGRFQDLIRRFREHTDRLFRKHGLESLGYWIPTDGTPKQRRRLVYILKHSSRYDAYRNWVNFGNDREWQTVLDRPEFQGLLSERPTSTYLTTTGFSPQVSKAVGAPGAILELRTSTAAPGRLSRLHRRYREHTVGLLAKHGIRSIASWTPFDAPESGNTLINLVQHAERKQADANWKAFHEDSAWQKVARESERGGKLLTAPPGRIHLKSIEISNPR